MNLLHKRPILFFTFFGFVLSIGGPLGFYVHDFIFNPLAHNTSFLEHVKYLHAHNLSVILYIGAGTNFFFSLFGYLTGLLVKKVFEGEQKLVLLQKSKNKLFTKVLTDMREPIGLGLESLNYIKTFTPFLNEQKMMIDKSIERFKEIDESIINLVIASDSQDKKYKKLAHQEILVLLSEFAKKNDIDLNDSISHEKILLGKMINLNLPVLNQILHLLSGWSETNEMHMSAVSVELFNQSQLKVFFTFPGMIDRSSSGLPEQLLQHLVESFDGRILLNNNKVELCLLIESHSKEDEDYAA